MVGAADWRLADRWTKSFHRPRAAWKARHRASDGSSTNRWRVRSRASSRASTKLSKLNVAGSGHVDCSDLKG